ncbi:MAG: hypothetical protein HQL15_07815 [Candidatus Omnitrophica bacterium]|nr:hypothetical protein [Candidatus Omnitrophota bacterium]
MSLEKHYSPPLVGGVRGGGISQNPPSLALPTRGRESNDVNALGSQIIRQTILPALEREVNEGKNFAMLRQVYSGMILATWYKRALKESLLGKIYANRSKVKGVDQQDSKTNEAIYQQYLKAYKKGVYNYIKEDIDKNTNQPIPRKYFSGGAVNDYAMILQTTKDGIQGDEAMSAGIESGLDKAMTILNEGNEITASQKVPDAAMTGKVVLPRGLEEYLQQSQIPGRFLNKVIKTSVVTGPILSIPFVLISQFSDLSRDGLSWKIVAVTTSLTFLVQLYREYAIRNKIRQGFFDPWFLQNSCGYFSDNQAITEYARYVFNNHQYPEESRKRAQEWLTPPKRAFQKGGIEFKVGLHVIVRIPYFLDDHPQTVGGPWKEATIGKVLSDGVIVDWNGTSVFIPNKQGQDRDVFPLVLDFLEGRSDLKIYFRNCAVRGESFSDLTENQLEGFIKQLKEAKDVSDLITLLERLKKTETFKKTDEEIETDYKTNKELLIEGMIEKLTPSIPSPAAAVDDAAMIANEYEKYQVLAKDLDSMLKLKSEIGSKINILPGVGYFIEIETASDHKAKVMIKVPAEMDKEGFVSNGVIDLENPDIIKRFVDIKEQVSSFGESYGAHEAQVMHYIRELGMILGNRQVTEQAKKRRSADVLRDLSHQLHNVIMFEDMKVNNDEASIEAFLTSMRTAFYNVMNNPSERQTERFIDWPQTNEQRMKNIALKFFYNDGGYRMGVPLPEEAISNVIGLMREFFELRALESSSQKTLDTPLPVQPVTEKSSYVRPKGSASTWDEAIKMIGLATEKDNLTATIKFRDIWGQEEVVKLGLVRLNSSNPLRVSLINGYNWKKGISAGISRKDFISITFDEAMVTGTFNKSNFVGYLTVEQLDFLSFYYGQVPFIETAGTFNDGTRSRRIIPLDNTPYTFTSFSNQEQDDQAMTVTKEVDKVDILEAMAILRRLNKSLEAGKKIAEFWVAIAAKMKTLGALDKDDSAAFFFKQMESAMGIERKILMSLRSI